MNPTIGQWLDMARQALAESASESPVLDAEVLLSFAMGRSRAWLLANKGEAIPRDALDKTETMLRRRVRGVPVAYITGTREFWSLPIRVTPDVLIPRPETELLVESALAVLPDGPCRLLDLGTGSGAIALALARERPKARVLAVDRSEAALSVARDNAQRLGIGNVRFIRSDWFGSLDGDPFELLVANPPYVAARDAALAGDVRYEPQEALVAGDDGMADLRKIIALAPHHLIAGGWLLVEHGCEQGNTVSTAFERAGLDQVDVIRDLSGLDRVTRGRTVAQLNRPGPAG